MKTKKVTLKEKIKELKEKYPDLNNRDIAEKLKCSHEWVKCVLRGGHNTGIRKNKAKAIQQQHERAGASPPQPKCLGVSWLCYRRADD